MNIIIEDGTIRREISTVIHKFSDSLFLISLVISESTF